MKSPLREAIEIVQDYRDLGNGDYFTCNNILLQLGLLLDKEKEAMCEFADYVRKCGQQSDHRGLMTTEELFEETFNTKYK
jgi:hypothetical protein